jgi:hypothetical protein
MKHLKSLSFLFALCTLTTTAFAADFHMFKAAKARKLTAEPTLLTINLIANPPFSATITAELFLGTSKTAPCSDLVSVGVSEPESYIFSSKVDELTSSDFVDDFGTTATCIKSDITFTATGHTYSTGNLQLLYDPNTSAYISVIPDKITLDISNQ